MLPGLSFRGAKRRGNLKQALTISPGLSCVPACTARLPRLLRSLAMTSQGGFPHPEGRNDKPESASLPCHCEEGASPTWESRGGSCAFAGAFLCSGVYCEIATAPAEPRNDKSDSLLHPDGRNDKAESLLLALITSRTRQNRNQPLEIATFPNQQTDPPIWDSSSLSAHPSVCGTSSLSASHARLLLSHPVLFQNKLIYEHDIAL